MRQQFLTKNDNVLERVSKWLPVKHNYNPSNRNSLYDYATDENGYRNGHIYFNPKNGLYLDYFTWNKRNYAINQFIILGGMMGGYPEMFNDVDGKLTVVSAYDAEDYYNPILIELDEYGENVRVYREINTTEQTIQLLKKKIGSSGPI